MARTHKQPRHALLSLQPALASRSTVADELRPSTLARKHTSRVVASAPFGFSKRSPALQAGHFIDLTV